MLKENYIKILGVHLGCDRSAARDARWSERLHKMQMCINYWGARELTLQGRVTVWNCLVASKLNYVLAVLDLPLWAKNRINEMISKFLWGAKKGKITAKTLWAGYEQGGLKLIDITSKLKAYRLKTVRKYLWDQIDYGWKYTMRFFLNNVLKMNDFVLLKTLKEPMTSVLPAFFKEVLAAQGEFLKYAQYDCADLALIKQMLIFGNNKIQKMERCLYDNKWIEAGFVQLKDIMYEFMPGFLTAGAIWECVCEKHEDTSLAKVETTRNDIMSCLPMTWRTAIEQTCEL